MKATAAKTCLIYLAVALLIVLAAMCFSPCEIASAADEATVIIAPVGDIKANATAQRSNILLYNGDDAFYIPESYFVTNINQIGDNVLYIVEYAGMSDLFMREVYDTQQVVIESGEAISPDVRLTLKEDADITIKFKKLTNDYTIKLLGFNGDSTQIYVSATYNGETVRGFVPKDSLEPFEVSYQQRAQAERDAWIESQKKPDPSKGELIPNSSVALRIVLIIGIAIPAVLIVLLLFKPSKADKNYSKRTVRQARSRDDFDYDDSRSYRRSERDDRYYDDRDYDRRRDYDRDYDRPRRRDERDDRYYDDRD